MSKNEIVEQIHREGKVLEMCKNIAKDLGDDLYQEWIMILLEHKTIEAIYEKAGSTFNYFLVKIILNIYKDDARRFQKKFKPFEPLLKDVVAINTLGEKIKLEKTLASVEIAMTEIDLEHRVNKIYPLGGRLFDIYLKEGSIRKVATATNINRNHVDAEIRKFKKQVLEKLKQKKCITS